VFAEPSILVVDDDAESRLVLERTLREAGLRPVTVATGAQALTYLETHTPAVVLLDLVLPATERLSLLERMRQLPRLEGAPLIVLTDLDADTEISRIFAAGADDYVHKPFRAAELLARIRGQIRMREYRERQKRREREQETVLELTQTLASTLDIRDILFTVVQRVAEFAQVDRCSIVLFAESGEVGYVLATSDDAMLRDLPIDLAKYPEIREVLTTGRALVIRDGSEYPLLRLVRQAGPNFGFNSFALLPILHEHGAMGVLF
jgi:DNA-binding response OmpR family regulator